MLAPWKKSYDQPRQNIKKQRHHLANKGLCVKAMIFSVVRYECKSWTIKKAVFQRIDAFELWCWRRLLRVPWIARRSNQSILKEINPEHSLEGLLQKLKLQYFGHLMWRANSLERKLDVGKDWRQKEKQGAENEIVGWHHWLNGQQSEQTLGSGRGQRNLVCYGLWGDNLVT